MGHSWGTVGAQNCISTWGTLGAQLGQKVTWGTLGAHLGQMQLGHSWGKIGTHLGQIQYSGIRLILIKLKITYTLLLIITPEDCLP